MCFQSQYLHKNLFGKAKNKFVDLQYKANKIKFQIVLFKMPFQNTQFMKGTCQCCMCDINIFMLKIIFKNL